METMEVMNNEMDEVMFVAEEIVPKNRNGLKFVGGVGVVALAGYGIYKGINWIKAKKKAKKEEEKIFVDCETENEDVND